MAGLGIDGSPRMSRASKDLAAIFVPATGAMALTMYFAAPISLDEVPLVGLVLALASAGYMWRRWMDLRGEVTRYDTLVRDLEHRATHDPLTGLPNRVLLMDRIEHALMLTDRSKKLVALLCLDMDRFKEVNDAFGHEVGDRLLKLVANLLRRSARHEDTVARLSGDEFVLLLEGLNEAHEAAQLAERVSETLRTAVILEGHKIRISVSVGVALSSSSENTPAELLRRADGAMYQAKREGKGTYRVS